MKSFVLSLLTLFFLEAGAASVDTITIQSKALDATTKCVIILPDNYKAKSSVRFPVVYLLHGYTGDYANWIKRVPEIKSYADKYELIIVCPDGKNGWYLDSKFVPHSNYESYVGRELPRYIDSAYRTQANRNSRAITGLSMGGHGAIYLAIRHKETFGATGSMSGVMDLVPWENGYGLQKLIGDSSATSSVVFSDLNLISKADTALRIKIDCGIDDPFIEANRAMHHKLISLKVAHDYSELPGGHNWDYWRNAVEFHLLFFRKYFDEKKEKNL